MSAYLCSDCQLSALAGYALRVMPPNAPTHAATIFRLLRRENLRSVIARYPSDRGKYPPGTLCAPCAAASFSPYEIHRAVSNYAYQSCEHDGWESSLAKALCDRVQRHIEAQLGLSEDALRASRSYKQAHWGLTTPQHS